MNTELLGVIVTFLITIVLAFPLGKYIAKVFAGEKTFTDFMNPFERFIFRISGIDPNKPMDWKEFLKAMLTINMVWLFYAFFLLLKQSHLPLNPDGNPDMTPDLSFNTAVEFVLCVHIVSFWLGSIISGTVNFALCIFTFYEKLSKS